MLLLAGIVLTFWLYLAFIAFMFNLFHRHRTRVARTVLETRARRHGYRLLASEQRYFRRGPFIFNGSGQGHVVLRFAALDKEGERRTGWARCGHSVFGMIDDRVAVEWDPVPTEELASERRQRASKKSPVWDQEFDG